MKMSTEWMKGRPVSKPGERRVRWEQDIEPTHNGGSQQRMQEQAQQQVQQEVQSGGSKSGGTVSSGALQESQRESRESQGAPGNSIASRVKQFKRISYNWGHRNERGTKCTGRAAGQKVSEVHGKRCSNTAENSSGTTQVSQAAGKSIANNHGGASHLHRCSDGERG